METLFRLLWKAFLDWLSRQAVGVDDRVKQSVADQSRECRNTVRQDCFVNDVWKALQGCVNPLITLFERFKSESREKSKVFLVSWKDTLIWYCCFCSSLKLNEPGTGNSTSPPQQIWFPIFSLWTGSIISGGFQSISLTCTCCS